MSGMRVVRHWCLVMVVLAMACCKPKDGREGEPEPSTKSLYDQSWFEKASKLPDRVPPKAHLEVEPTQDEGAETVDTLSTKGKLKAVDPQILWTGSKYVVVWVEVGEWEPKSHAIVANVNTWDMTDYEEFRVNLLVVGADSGPVILEGAGEGPKKLVGPLFSNPAWHHDAVVLAWTLWNEDPDPPYPARYVVGLWREDGTVAAEPQIASKEKLHESSYIYDEAPDTWLVSTPSALYYAVPAGSWNKKSGCKGVHGATDSLELFVIGPEGEVLDTRFECADVMGAYHISRFGDGLMSLIFNHHVGEHGYLIFDMLGKHDLSQHWIGENPVKDLLMTGGGAAVWYDEMKTYGQVSGHCVRIEVADGVEGGPETKCARPKSRKLVWNDDGLFIEITAKDGKAYRIPYLPGDRIHPKLLRKELVEKVPFTSAVFGGNSIGLAWSKGKKVTYRVIEREDLGTSSVED
jgi:hypothetical protein